MEAWINLDSGSEAFFKYEKVLGRSLKLVKSWVFSEVLKSGFSLKRVSGSAEIFCVLGGFVKCWFLCIVTVPLFLAKVVFNFFKG